MQRVFFILVFLLIFLKNIQSESFLHSNSDCLNKFCGGIAGIHCCKGFECVLDDPKIADSGGKCLKCVKKGGICGGIVGKICCKGYCKYKHGDDFGYCKL